MLLTQVNIQLGISYTNITSHLKPWSKGRVGIKSKLGCWKQICNCFLALTIFWVSDAFFTNSLYRPSFCHLKLTHYSFLSCLVVNLDKLNSFIRVSWKKNLSIKNCLSDWYIPFSNKKFINQHKASSKAILTKFTIILESSLGNSYVKILTFE